MSDQTIDRLQIEINAKSNSGAEGVDRLAQSIERLLSVTGKGVGELSGIAKSISEMKSALSGTASGANGLSRMAQSLQAIRNLNLTGVGKSLSTFSKQVSSLNGVGSGLNSIRDFSKGMTSMTKGIGKINSLDLTNTASQIKTLVTAIKPLTDEMLRGGTAANSYGTQLKEMAQAVKTMNSIKGSPQGLRASASSINNKLGIGLDVAKLASAVYAVEHVGTVIAGFISNINSYIENVNLFTVAMGDAADEGARFAQTLQDALGVDAGEAMRNMGLFKQLTSSFGATSEQSTILAKNMTQLGYDLSSFFNLSIDEAFTKLQSGIAGEIEPLRRIGIDLSEARLQQELYNLGIDQSVAKLTQADKALLRYIAVMRQTTNAQGDMARTIMTPANALRVLQAQLQVAGRAIGSIFIPALTAILPPAIAVVKVIGEAASAVARFFGFEMPTIDYSSLTDMPTIDITNDIDDITGSTDDYTDSVKEASKATKTLISGFDELNILKAPTEPSTGKDKDGESGGANFGSILGDIKLPEYDMLMGGVDSEIDEWVDKIKSAIDTATKVIEPFIPLLEGVAAAVATAFAVNSFKNFFQFTKQLPYMNDLIFAAQFGFDTFKETLKKTNGTTGKFRSLLKASNAGLKDFRALVPKAVKAAVGVGGVVANFQAASTAIEAATLQTEGWESKLLGMGGTFAITEGLLYAFCGPWGAVAGAVAGVIGALKGYNDAQVELRQNRMEEDFFDGTGVALDTLTDMLMTNTSHIQAYSEEILKLKEQYDRNTDSINNNITQLENYSTKLSLTGTLTSEEAQKMKESFDNLVKSLQDNFSLNTQMIFEGFSNMSKETAEALGMDVGEMTVILQQFQDTFNSKTSSIQSETDKLIDKLQNGGKLSDADYDRLTQNISTMAELNGDVLTNKVELQNALKELQGIDYENVETAQTKVSELGTKATELYNNYLTAFDNQITAAETQKAQFDVLYANGYIDQETYDQIKSTYETVTKALQTSFDENKKGLEDQISAAFEFVQSDISSEVLRLANEDGTPTIFEIMKNSFLADGDVEAYNMYVHHDAVEAAKKVVDPVQQALDEQIKNFEAQTGAKAIGEDVMEGLKNGINENDSKAIDAIRQSCAKVIDEARYTFDSHSPSKEFEDIGRDDMAGLSDGLEKNNAAITSCRESAKEVLGVARDTLSYDEFKKIGEKAAKGITEGLKDIKFPDIKIPHFEIKYDTLGGDAKPWKDMGLQGRPEVDVNWYARGGIFDSPQIIGVGEQGREAVVPLEDNSPWINALAENVSAQITSDGSESNERLMAFINLCTDRVIDAIQENGNVLVQANLDGDDIAERVLVRKGGRR